MHYKVHINSPRYRKHLQEISALAASFEYPGSDLSNLMFAIGHFISTGDYFGEGLVSRSHESPGNILVIITVKTMNTIDSNDWLCLESRLKEIQMAGDLTISIKELPSLGETTMKFYGLHLSYSDVPRLTMLLREAGPLGRGSGHQALLDFGK